MNVRKRSLKRMSRELLVDRLLHELRRPGSTAEFKRRFLHPVCQQIADKLTKEREQA